MARKKRSFHIGKGSIRKGFTKTQAKGMCISYKMVSGNRKKRCFVVRVGKRKFLPSFLRTERNEMLKR